MRLLPLFIGEVIVSLIIRHFLEREKEKNDNDGNRVLSHTTKKFFPYCFIQDFACVILFFSRYLRASRFY